MEKLTTSDYWDETYAKASGDELEVRGFRDLGQRRVVELIESVGLTGQRVLEVGAGNSAVLCYLARHHPQASFLGLDYAAAGCAMLRERVRRESVSVGVIQEDLFRLSSEHIGAYDVVYSLGLVEHFTDLPAVLAAKMKLLRVGGTLVTVIPNMAGMIGRLTRRFNPRIFALHVPHDLRSLVAGHRAAGAIVQQQGYLCSTNFGVLSSCFEGPSQAGWKTYKWLARLTTALWFIEWHSFDLPRTRQLSPYLYVVGKRAA